MPRLADAAVRIAIVALAVAIGAYALSTHRAEDRCSEAGAAVLREAQGVGSRAESAEAVRTLSRDDCRDTRAALVAADSLLIVGRDGVGRRLARQVVEREPDNAAAWLVLSRTLERTDPAGSRHALRRARSLNPRGVRSR